MASNIISINKDEEYFIQDEEVLRQIRNILAQNAVKIKEGGDTVIEDDLVVEIEETASIHSKYSSKDSGEQDES